MKPENQIPAKGASFSKPSFSGSMLNFGGVYYVYIYMINTWKKMIMRRFASPRIYTVFWWHFFESSLKLELHGCVMILYAPVWYGFARQMHVQYMVVDRRTKRR